MIIPLSILNSLKEVKTWSVTVATTPAEITTGLGGQIGITPGTGMLFDMGGVLNSIAINMDPMLFSLDIMFLDAGSSNPKIGTVVGVFKNVAPHANFTFPGQARYFVEVNAGEASSISVGDVYEMPVVEQPTGFNIGSFITMMTPFVVMVPVARMMVKATSNPKKEKLQTYTESLITSTSQINALCSKGEIKKADVKDILNFRKSIDDRPFTLNEWKESKSYKTATTLDKAYWNAYNMDTGETASDEEGLDGITSSGKAAEKYILKNWGTQSNSVVRVYDSPIFDNESFSSERVLCNGVRIVPSIRQREVMVAMALEGPYIIKSAVHGGNWSIKTKGRIFIIHPDGSPDPDIHNSIEDLDKRQELVSEYGSWTVGFAESRCPDNDIDCVARIAKHQSTKIKQRAAFFGAQDDKLSSISNK